jgi:fucose 4-O-acetylase-like acetyltransferase
MLQKLFHYLPKNTQYVMLEHCACIQCTTLRLYAEAKLKLRRTLIILNLLMTLPFNSNNVLLS